MMKLLNKITIHPITYFLIFILLSEGLIKYFIIISIIICIHELGHIFFLKLFKRKIIKINILPFGGLINVDSYISTNIYEDMLIAIGGIFFQCIFGLTIMHMGIRYLDLFLFYNKLIIIFNLFPILPLDGEKILNAFLNIFVSFKKSMIASIYLSLITIIFILVFNTNIIYKNLPVIIFLIISSYKNLKNVSICMNAFYLERMNHTFNFNKNKNIKNIQSMYKNKNNLLYKECEHVFIKKHFKLINDRK